MLHLKRSASPGTAFFFSSSLRTPHSVMLILNFAGISLSLRSSVLKYLSPPPSREMSIPSTSDARLLIPNSMNWVFPPPASNVIPSSMTISVAGATLNTTWLMRVPVSVLKTNLTFACPSSPSAGASDAAMWQSLYLPLVVALLTAQFSSALMVILSVRSGLSIFSPYTFISSILAPIILGGSPATRVSPKSLYRTIL